MLKLFIRNRRKIRAFGKDYKVVVICIEGKGVILNMKKESRMKLISLIDLDDTFSRDVDKDIAKARKNADRMESEIREIHSKMRLLL